MITYDDHTDHLGFCLTCTRVRWLRTELEPGEPGYQKTSPHGQCRSCARDLADLTGHELAKAYAYTEEQGDTDQLVYYENEIAFRLGLDPDQTEQGLTGAAGLAVDRFLRDHI